MPPSPYVVHVAGRGRVTDSENKTKQKQKQNKTNKNKNKNKKNILDFQLESHQLEFSINLHLSNIPHVPENASLKKKQTNKPTKTKQNKKQNKTKKKDNYHDAMYKCTLNKGLLFICCYHIV